LLVRRLALTALVAAILVNTSTLATAETDTPFPCVGRWQGLGKNTGFPDSWTIDMVVHPPDARGVCGTIEYTNPKCGGVIESCVGTGEVRVRERYNHGHANCAPPGEVRFSCEGDRMAWSWHGWEVVRSTLTRIGPPPAPLPTQPVVAPTVVPTATASSSPPPQPAQPEERSPRTGGRCGCEIVGARASHDVWVLLACLGVAAISRRGSRSRR
jgi:hypothetical protein